MKNTGITRKVDDLGRIVIPKPIRRQFGIVDGVTEVECLVDTDGNFVIKNPKESLEQRIKDITSDKTITDYEKIQRIKVCLA